MESAKWKDALDRLLPRIRSIAGADDEDLYQEVAVKLLDAGDRAGEVPAAYVWVVVHNCWCDLKRRDRRWAKTVSCDSEDFEPPMAQPPSLLDLEVRELLSTLPADDRQLMKLRYLGHSFAEIAAIVSKSPKAVESRWYRARKRIRSKVRDSAD